jgi:hypothetical protein
MRSRASTASEPASARSQSAIQEEAEGESVQEEEEQRPEEDEVERPSTPKMKKGTK